MKLRGAYWPVSRTVPCAKMQEEFDCDPQVASLFPTDMVKRRMPSEPTFIHEATEQEWRLLAEKWKRGESWNFRPQMNYH